MTISLVLATVGRTDLLLRCMHSLAAQSSKDFEVLIVDQNPDDRLVPLLSEGSAIGLQIRHLRLDRPSLSGARNLGLQQARGLVIGFPDDDCWYEPDTIAAIQQAFAADTSLSGVVACWAEQTAARRGQAATGVLSNTAWRNYRGGDASSITLFLRRDLLRKLNGFDTRFGVGCWYGAAEEIDLVLRALGSGARIAHCPAATVHHIFASVPPRLTNSTLRSARFRARGTGAIYAKHKLPIWPVLRGLIAPLALPALRLRWRDFVLGCCVSLGRLEGFVRWNVMDR